MWQCVKRHTDLMRSYEDDARESMHSELLTPAEALTSLLDSEEYPLLLEWRGHFNWCAERSAVGRKSDCILCNPTPVYA